MYTFEYYNGSSWINVTSKIEDSQNFLNIELDVEEKHIVNFQGLSLSYKGSSAIANGYFFRILDDSLPTGKECVFSGYINNLVWEQKYSEAKFDIVPEVVFLSEQIVTAGWFGGVGSAVDTARLALEAAAPSGYTIAGMDSLADDALDDTGFAPPLNIAFTDQPFTDLLFDVLLVLNHAYDIYCRVANKVIEFYTTDPSADSFDSSLLRAVYLDYTDKPLHYILGATIDTYLRGTGSTGLTGGGEGYISKRLHEIHSYESFPLYTLMDISWALTEGLIIGIRKENNLYIYTVYEKVT